MTVDETITVTRNDEARRYEIHVDDRLGGFTVFRVDPEGRLVFPHTEIDPAFGGRGLGGILVDEALSDVARRGETVVPVCPFVVKQLKKKDVAGLIVAWPDEDDAQDAATRRAAGVTRLDEEPTETTASAPVVGGPRALLLESREVPLGGVRAMSVHRALPQRDLPMVGAWCFLDRFGPQEARMRVEPHPHIGLQTVTWPFVGDVRHRDTLGSDVVVRRGALNLMTSGRGIAHSEYSLGEGAVPLDALQLWVALPDSTRSGSPAFERHEDLPVTPLRGDDGERSGEAVVVLGELDGVTSPATVHTPIVGAELRLEAGATTRLPLRPDWEYAIVGVFGDAEADTSSGSATAGGDADASSRSATARGDAAASARVTVTDQHLLYLGTGRDHIEITASVGATLFLIGGEPFPDEIVMWWNFVGRSHDEIVEARDEWEAGTERFGRVDGHGDVRIPAPPLPAVRLMPRRRGI